MAETLLKIVKVFIGSPGGLEDERQTARRIVEETNQSHSERWGCQIQLVGWEATLPGYSRAQSLINQDLDKCEYFIGVLWDNWGSKPEDGDGEYTSGFEEEYERAKKRTEIGLMKDIALYFKDINEVQLKNLHPTYQQVQRFREHCIQQRRPLFKDFKKTSDFESLFRAKINDIGWLESTSHKTLQSEPAEPEQPAKNDLIMPSPVNGGGLIRAPSIKFVSELLQRPSDWDKTDAFEVARLRLIACSISRQGNDELYLGNHDANLLYVKRQDFNFSKQEILALIDTGVVGFGIQNVPLWHWISRLSEEGIRRLEILAVFGVTQEKINAIAVLQNLGRSTPKIDDYFDREKIIENWIAGESNDVATAAFEFLQSNGQYEDLKTIQGLLEALPAERKAAAAVSVIVLSSKQNISAGFQKLVEFDPDPIKEQVADQLFVRPNSIPTDILKQCMELKSDAIRKRAIKLLYSRNEIDVPTAERHLTDNRPEVRLIAIEYLEHEKKAPDDATIRKALVLPRSGLYAIGGSSSDNSYYEKYRANKLSKLPFEKLRELVSSADVYDYLEVAALNRRYARRNIEDIKTNLADGFKSHFDSRLARWESEYGKDSKLVADSRSLESFLRRRLTSVTLDAFCEIAKEEDLSFVRNTLDAHELDFLESALRFLSRHGDWSDCRRILSFVDNYAMSSLLGWAWDERKRLVAIALYEVGKDRLVDMLNMKLYQVPLIRTRAPNGVIRWT